MTARDRLVNDRELRKALRQVSGYEPSAAVLEATRVYGEAMERMGGRADPYEKPILYVDPTDHEFDNAREYIICETCKVPLNQLTSSDGDVEWLHTRSWQTFDHPPSPMVADRADAVDAACDFCGTTTVMYWCYTGDRVQVTKGNTVNDYGYRWSACQDCGPFIDAGDLEGLLQRALRVGPTTSKLNWIEKQHVGQAWMELWMEFIPTIRDREYIGPKREPAKLSARLMPKLQVGLMRFWRNVDFQSTGGEALRNFSASIPGVHTGEEDTFLLNYPPGLAVPQNVWGNHCQHLAAGIGTAEMYWISDNFTRLAIHAGKKFEKLEVTREELPAPFGFMVFADPIGEIPRPGGAAAVRAVTWTLVPGGVWLNLYMQGEDGDSEIDVAMMRQEVGYLLCPNAGLGFMFGDSIPLPEADESDLDYSFIRTIFATWTLIQQPGVAGLERAPVDKKYARSFQRENHRPLPPVNLVDLRKRPRPKTKPEGAGGKQWTERRMVSGHMKRQFWGPGRAYRKWIYVDDYVAGPEDAPLREPRRTVKVLR